MDFAKGSYVRDYKTNKLIPWNVLYLDTVYKYIDDLSNIASTYLPFIDIEILSSLEALVGLQQSIKKPFYQDIFIKLPNQKVNIESTDSKAIVLLTNLKNILFYSEKLFKHIEPDFNSGWIRYQTGIGHSCIIRTLNGTIVPTAQNFFKFLYLIYNYLPNFNIWFLLDKDAPMVIDDKYTPFYY